MAAERTAVQVKARFETEQRYIRQYVDFLLPKGGITEEQVADLSDTLKGYGLPRLPRRKYHRLRKPYTDHEIDLLITSIQDLRPLALKTLVKLEKRRANYPVFFTLTGMGAEHPGLLYEWTSFFLEHMSKEPTRRECAQLRRYAFRESRNQHHRDLPQKVIDGIIVDAIDHAVGLKAESTHSELSRGLVTLDELCLLRRIAEPAAEINIRRQGFILLMTAFDAAVFDLFRIALTKDFFGLLGKLAKSDKDSVSLRSVAQAGSLEKVRDRIIEEQVKGRYLRELLVLLDSLGVQCVDKRRGVKLVNLIELVLRRNLHVHNRGVVDAKYLESEPGHKPKYNLYNLKIGDIAAIDTRYWKRSNRLCADCIDRIVRWTEGLGQSNSPGKVKTSPGQLVSRRSLSRGNSNPRPPDRQSAAGAPTGR
jgi:hypothetical protein